MRKELHRTREEKEVKEPIEEALDIYKDLLSTC
jgi:hypothetical protein